MLQHKFTKLLTILAVSTGLSVFTPALTQLTQPTIVNADATDLPADSPWEHTDQGPEYRLKPNDGNVIYYSIAPNDANHALFQNAVAQWDSLGVLKFQQVSWGDSRSQITMHTAAQNSANGDETNGQNMPEKVFAENGNVYVTTNDLELFPANSDMTYAQQQVVVEHEIGHALGFAHDNRKFKFNGKKYRNYRMIMNQYGNYAHYYGLGGIEQKTLADHYGITPSVDLSSLTY